MENTTTTTTPDQVQQLNGIDQSTLQSLLGGSNGSSTSLIPESLTHTLTIGFIALNVISVLFLILYLLSVIRKWKVQSAVLHMQKDVAEIKAHMVIAPTAPAVAKTVEQAPEPQPQVNNEQPQA
jgi:hypothetical protein